MIEDSDHSWSVGGGESSDGDIRSHGTDTLEKERAEEAAVAELTRRETRGVRLWRGFTLLTLIAVSVAVSTITYRLLRNQDVKEFQNSYEFFAAAIQNAIETHIEDVFSAGELVSVQVTKASIEKNESFPFVTLDLFEIIGSQARKLSGVDEIIWSPMVAVEDYDAWTAYATANIGWYNASIGQYVPEESEDSEDSEGEEEEDVEEENEEEEEEDEEEGHRKIEGYDFSDTNYSISSPGDDQNVGPGPWAPAWQVSPPPPGSYIINLDMYAYGTKTVEEAVDKLRMGLMTEVIATPGEENVPPRCVVVEPVFEHLLDDLTAPIVGHVYSTFSWESYLIGLLPKGVSGINLILMNTCGQAFTYTINGRSAEFMGAGDLHDSRYNHMEVIIPFYDDEADDQGDIDQIEGHCVYDLHIFPTENFAKQYRSSNPLKATTILAFAFAFMITAFLMFDTFVVRRNRKLLIAMTRTNAIVSSLFPSTVRDRIFAQAKHENEEKKAMNDKNRLKTFLSDGKDRDNEMGDENDDYMYKTKPIADLFPETTILFADLAGFTAWSSMREPTQVFILLETIYKAMDDIAKARRVFKVETVGDCYVAVTGLPDPRKDHAVAMCRFALDCVQKMDVLTKKLEVILGPDTTDLKMRVGLHSGPVTAGVLRGERSRFQLFGDTMNTASRMESNGLPGKIHISQETARLLIAAGKEHWVIPREELIVAKGKGELQTYWLVTTKASNHTRSETASSETSGEVGGNMISGAAHDIVPEMDEKTDRLVKWNVEVLAALLKKVIARRTDVVNTIEPAPRTSASKVTTTPLEEVQEIIHMPVFNRGSGAETKEEDLDDIVLEQLMEYVTAIASMYRSNPFHNFEHASYVTMSVVKLLSRIVAPDVDAVNSDMESTLHDYTYGITSDPLTQFACVLSALIHDVDHPGVPNTQLVIENPQLAKFYSSKSIAEQNSVDLSWELLQDSTFKDLRLAICPTEHDRIRFRQLVVNSVMATDIMDKDLKALRNMRWEKAFAGQNHEESVLEAVDRKATIVIEHLIQASDVSHTMQHWHIYTKWNQRLFEEMYSAYIQGRSAADPSENWYKGEIGFFDFYIIPLAKKLRECGVFGVSSDEYLNYAEKNRQEWEARGMEVVAGMVEAAHKKYGTKLE